MGNMVSQAARPIAQSAVNAPPQMTPGPAMRPMMPAPQMTPGPMGRPVAQPGGMPISPMGPGQMTAGSGFPPQAIPPQGPPAMQPGAAPTGMPMTPAMLPGQGPAMGRPAMPLPANSPRAVMMSRMLGRGM